MPLVKNGAASRTDVNVDRWADKPVPNDDGAICVERRGRKDGRPIDEWAQCGVVGGARKAAMSAFARQCAVKSRRDVEEFVEDRAKAFAGRRRAEKERAKRYPIKDAASRNADEGPTREPVVRVAFTGCVVGKPANRREAAAARFTSDKQDAACAKVSKDRF